GASVVLLQGGFLIRGPAGQYYNIPWSTLGDPASNQARTQLVRYDSPTVAGFIYSASIAEDASYWGTMLRYANEFQGFRIAAGIGYERANQRQANVGCFPTGLGPPTTCLAGSGAGPADLAKAPPDVQGWGAGLSVLHVPSGLFAQGHYL